MLYSEFGIEILYWIRLEFPVLFINGMHTISSTIPLFIYHIRLTNDLDIVGHVLKLDPLLHHLFPHFVLDDIVPLQADGELGDPAEEDGG